MDSQFVFQNVHVRHKSVGRVVISAARRIADGKVSCVGAFFESSGEDR